MEKVVEFLVGLPCSGKSTYLNENYKEEDIYVISMDNIRYEYAKKLDWTYDELFKRPNETDIERGNTHKKYGSITENKNWERVEHINKMMANDFSSSVRRSQTALNEGKRVVIDMTNLTRKERTKARKWFKDIEEVKFAAVIFDFEENMDLIKEQNRIRGKAENKYIPDFVITQMAEKYMPIEMDENITEIKFVDGLKGLKEEKKQEHVQKVKANRSSRPRKRLR